MKKSFSKLENKYYYGISRTFWHFFAVIAVVSCIAGVLVIGWSYVPPSKVKVTKAPSPARESYPSQTKVTLDEILNALPKDKAKIEAIKNQESSEIVFQEEINEETQQDTTGYALYKNKIGVLKNLLPISKYPKLWNGDGYYTYPRGEALYKIKRLESLRKFVKTSSGLEERIENRMDRNGFKGFGDKAKILEKSISILETLEFEQRRDLIYSLVSIKNGDLDKTVNSLETLSSLINLFDNDNKVRAFERNSTFLKNHPNDGIGLLNFQTEILSRFSKNERYGASNIISSEYVNRYNNNLEGIKENTLNFEPMLKNIGANKQAIALNYYYNIYRSKNKNRISQIEKINRSFQNKLKQNENDYQYLLAKAQRKLAARQQAKSVWRWNSIKAIGAGLGTVLLVTIILLLLSMIRNVNKLAQAMLKNVSENKK